MTPLARARRALPFSFALYVLEATVATLFALPLGLELLGRLRTTAWDNTQVARLLDSGPELAAALRTGGATLLLTALLWLVIGPWLQMSWLHVLTHGGDSLSALHAGSRRYLRACWVSLWVLLLTLLLCLPFVLIGYSVHSGLDSSTDARFHDLVLLATLSPLVLVVLFSALLHDLARASALESSALSSVLHGLRAALRIRAPLRMLGLTSLGYGAVLLSEWLVSRLVGLSLRFVLTVALLQGALLFRTFVRSWWLSCALTCVADELEPGLRDSRREESA